MKRNRQNPFEAQIAEIDKRLLEPICDFERKELEIQRRGLVRLAEAHNERKARDQSWYGGYDE